jgi:hypothetical protein
MTAPPFTDAVCLRQLIRWGHTRVGVFAVIDPFRPLEALRCERGK